MGPSEIKSTSLTLRFKHGKNTILLFAESSTPFTTILTSLLEVLRERYPEGLPMGEDQVTTPIPTDIGDVALAEPTDKFDTTKGWTELDIGGNIKDSPASLGIKEGAVLAFTFTGDDDGAARFWVEYPDLEALYGDEA